MTTSGQSASVGDQLPTSAMTLFADDIDGLAASEDELRQLIAKLEKMSTAYGMGINAEKTKIMSNNEFKSEVKVGGQSLEKVSSFKYLGYLISAERSKAEILARKAQTTAALCKLRNIWRSKKITLEMRCFRKIVNISYKDQVLNEAVRERITNVIGPHKDLLSTIRGKY